MASAAQAKYRNSPIHYIKLKPSGLDLKSFKSLANLFLMKNDKQRERDKSYKGRKISNFVDDKEDNSMAKVNYIKLGKGKTKAYQEKYKKYYQKKKIRK